MTKKDYELIAGVFLRHKRGQLADDKKDLTREEYSAEIQCHRELADKLAEVLERENPRFDRIRFMKACDVEIW